MNQKELKELIEFLIEKDITEFELERGDVKVRIKRGAEPVVSVSAPGSGHFPVPAAPPPARDAGSAPAIPSPPAPPKETGLRLRKVCTWCALPSWGRITSLHLPGSPPFVKPGDAVETGQILCIVEAMKLMNEIESDATGELVKILVTNGQPIEYGQELFAIRARK